MEAIDHLADDTVYLSMNQVMNPFGGAKTTSKDDEIIDYFLENNNMLEVCEFYKRGSCRYGDSCKYLHPKSL